MRLRLLFICVIPGVGAAALGEVSKPVPPPVLLKAFGSGEGNWRGSPVVTDIDGDRRPEIIVSVWNQLQVYSNTGALLWTCSCKGRNYSGAVVGDVDGDRLKEVMFADNQGNVYCVDHRGKLKPGWPQQVKLSADVRSIATADVDADGADEVIVFSSLTDKGCEPNMYVYEGNGKVKQGWPHYHPGDPYLGKAFDHAGGFNCNLAVGDITGDGQMEIICPQDYGSVSIFSANGIPVYVHNKFLSHGAGPKVHWGEVRSWGNSQLERQKWGPGSDYFMEFTYSPAMIADIDLDGRPEVICVPNLEKGGQIGPFQGSALCVWNVDRTYKAGFDPAPRVTSALVGEGQGGAEGNPVAVAGDITGDARLEIVVTHVDGTCRAYDVFGKELWSVKVLPSSDCAVSEPLLADVTGDSKADVIVLSSAAITKQTELIVIDGKGRRRLSFKMPFFTLSAPTLADVTGNGRPEMIICATKPGEGKTVYIYRWDALNPRCIVWRTGRGNFGHTGCIGGRSGGGSLNIEKHIRRIKWSTASRGLKLGIGVVPGKKARRPGDEETRAGWLLVFQWSKSYKRNVVLPKDLKVVLKLDGKAITLVDMSGDADAGPVEIEPGKMFDLCTLAGFDYKALPQPPAGRFRASIEISGKEPAGTKPSTSYAPGEPYYWTGSLKTRTWMFRGSE